MNMTNHAFGRCHSPVEIDPLLWDCCAGKYSAELCSLSTG